MDIMSNGLAPALALAMAVGSAAAQVTTFNLYTNLVTIPSVTVGDGSYTGVTLRHLGNYVFSLQSATAQNPPAPGVANYDVASGLLTIPAVQVSGATYIDVTLLNSGDYTFGLRGATLLPSVIADAVNALLAATDAQWASAVPPSGAARVAYYDGCWRHNGKTKTYLVADTDGDLARYRAEEAYQIGRKTSNIQVLAVRTLGNADGSTRAEIDVQFDIAYTDR